MGSHIEIDVRVVSNYERITILIKFVSTDRLNIQLLCDQNNKSNSTEY